MARYTMASKRPSYGKIQFDSMAEYEFFLKLKTLFPLDKIKCHNPVSIRPENKWFPAENWKVDFTVVNLDEVDGNVLYFEYKGVVEDSFKQKMRNLAHFRPEIYSHLVIVCPVVKVITRGLISVTPTMVEAYCKRKQYSDLVNDCKKERKFNV